MKKLSFNVKKNFVISILVVTSIVLGVGVISYITNEHKVKDIQVLAKDNKPIKVKADEKKLDVEESSKDKTVSTNTEAPKKEIVPTKPEPPKEKPKTQDDIANINKVPTYTEKQVKPQTQEAPKGGEANSKGQIYLPGFGWVDNEGGGGQGTNVNSNGDINKQVGNMD